MLRDLATLATLALYLENRRLPRLSDGTKHYTKCDIWWTNDATTSQPACAIQGHRIKVGLVRFSFWDSAETEVLEAICQVCHFVCFRCQRRTEINLPNQYWCTLRCTLTLGGDASGS